MAFEVLEKKDIEPVFNFMKIQAARIESLTFENFLLKESYMTTQQVLDYTGFAKDWLIARQEDIGYYQDGKEKRFKRADIDEYMNKHRIQRKIK